MSNSISGDPKFGGDFEKALGAIKARAIVMPASTDLYLPPEDSMYEVEHMPNAKLQVIQTVLGHFAGGSAGAAGISPEDLKVLDAALVELLAS